MMYLSLSKHILFFKHNLSLSRETCFFYFWMDEFPHPTIFPTKKLIDVRWLPASPEAQFSATGSLEIPGLEKTAHFLGANCYF